jgi:hypothetical protein
MCEKLWSPKKYLYFGKNYDMSGKFFVYLEKLQYVRKKLVCPEKFLRPPPSFHDLHFTHQHFWEKKY